MTKTILQRVSESMGREIVKIQCKGQTNLNLNSTYAPIELVEGPLQGQIKGVSVDGVQNTISLPKGKFKIAFSANLISSSVRSNISWRLSIDNTTYQDYIGSNYTRKASGHDESGDFIMDYFELDSPDSIQILGKAEAAAGTVSLENSSYILIEKI